MSCSYADGLSQYENKGVLGLEEVKIVYSLSLVWRESAIRDDFFNRSPARCVKTSVAFFFLSLLLPSPPAFLFSFLFLLFFFFSFYFFFLFFFTEIRQRRDVATEVWPSSRLDTGGTTRSRSHRRRHQHCCGHSGFSVIIICNFSLESPPYFYLPSSPPTTQARSAAAIPISVICSKAPLGQFF